MRSLDDLSGGPRPQCSRSGLTKASTDELFARLRHTGDARAREALFERFLPLARRLARRYNHPGGSPEDLMQVAGLGLVGAIDRFDPTRGTTFATFAIPTILGELKRYFRDSGWAAHVPRRAQELSLRIERAAQQLAARDGRSPSIQELAQYLEISTEEVLTGLTAATAHFTLSLETPATGDDDTTDITLAETIGEIDDGYDVVDTTVSLAAAIPTLSLLQRRALALRLERNLMQAEIAQQLGCSQMQVSRLLRDAATRLRAAMGMYDDEQTPDTA